MLNHCLYCPRRSTHSSRDKSTRCDPDFSNLESNVNMAFVHSDGYRHAHALTRNSF